jgi:glutaredoxin 2
MLIDFIKQLFGMDNTPKEPPKHIDNLALYYFDSCPYCRAVLRQLKRLNISVELRHIHKDDSHKQTLVKNGGKKTVPCLLIDKDSKSAKWMYESMDIIEYLNQNYA